LPTNILVNPSPIHADPPAPRGFPLIGARPPVLLFRVSQGSIFNSWVFFHFRSPGRGQSQGAPSFDSCFPRCLRRGIPFGFWMPSVSLSLVRFRPQKPQTQTFTRRGRPDSMCPSQFVSCSLVLFLFLPFCGKSDGDLSPHLYQAAIRRPTGGLVRFFPRVLPPHPLPPRSPQPNFA